MTLEGTTNNIIDRLLLERAARENEVKMNTLPRKRGPVAKPPIHNLFGPPQPTLAGGMDVDGGGREESGSVETTLGAGREEREDGSEAEVANADIADLFAAVHVRCAVSVSVCKRNARGLGLKYDDCSAGQSTRHSFDTTTPVSARG